MTRTAPFSAKAIRNACIAAAFAVAPVGVYAVGSAHNAKTLAACNSGETLVCYEVVDSKKAEITNAKYLADRKRSEEALAQAKADSEKQAAARKERKAAADAKIAEAKAAAEAKFQAEGWWEQEPGIFVRWCGGEHGYCPGKASYQDYTWRAMVWCKERACGDIYARLNISQNGTVVGWTNETAYGGYGQKVVLTFGSYTRGSGTIVEFNARG